MPNDQGIKRKQRLSGTCTIPDASKQNKGSLKSGKTGKCAKPASASASPNKTALLPVDVSVANTAMNQGDSQGLTQQDFHFYPVDAEWQQQACHILGLEYHCPNHCSSGNPNMSLTSPNLQTVRKITGDENCLCHSSR